MGILDSLARTESGGNWGALNPYGYGGRLQFGTARLADAARAGIVPAGITGADFARMTPEQQMAVEQWHFADIDRQAQAQGLDRYIGQSVGGVPITQDAIRAMAHLGGIGGAARFLESGGAYNPADANGTSLLDYARTHGGAGSMQQPAVTMSAMNAPEPQQPRGLFERLAANNPGNGILGALADPDRRARLAIALEGMTLNPNDAFISTLMQDMQNRRDDRQIQRTVEMLTGMGRADLAEAVGAGALSPNDATAIALTPAPARELIEVNGQLVDPVTGDVVGDYRDPQGADQTSAIQNYEFLIAQGVDPATAQEQAFGGGGVTINTGDSAPAIGTIPQGFQAIQDPQTGAWSMQAIPGGPEDRTATQEAAAQSNDTATRVIMSAAQRAREAAEDRAVGGIAGQWVSQLNPGSMNAEVYRQVQVLQSNATIENLQAMRAESPTGGALGGVTERENAMLAEKAGALNPASPNFLRDLDDYELTLLQIIHGNEEGARIFEQTRNGAMPTSAAASAGTAPAQSADVGRFANMGASEIAGILPSLTGDERDQAIARLRHIAGE